MPPSPSLRVGPSGWEYPGWKGVVYPARRAGPRSIPSSICRAPSTWLRSRARSAGRCAPRLRGSGSRRSPGTPAFQFTAVLGRRFSYERSLDPVEVARFKEGLRPLLGADRFGCLLLQFAWAFRFTPENREFLIQLRRAFHEFPMAVEMRHASWMAEEALGTLIDYRLGFANIDQPPQASAMPPSALVTSVDGVRPAARPRPRSTGAASSTPHPGSTTTSTRRPNWPNGSSGSSTSRLTRGRRSSILANPAAGRSVVNGLQLAALLGAEPDAHTPRRAVA